VWRIVVSGRFGVSRASEILENWTQAELDEAHRALDFQQELECPGPDESHDGDE